MQHSPFGIEFLIRQAILFLQRIWQDVMTVSVKLVFRLLMLQSQLLTIFANLCLTGSYGTGDATLQQKLSRSTADYFEVWSLDKALDPRVAVRRFLLKLNKMSFLFYSVIYMGKHHKTCLRRCRL